MSDEDRALIDLTTLRSRAEPLLAKITLGEWNQWGSLIGALGQRFICQMVDGTTSGHVPPIQPDSEAWDELMADAAFIAAAPQLVRDLLTFAEGVTRQVEDWRAHYEASLTNWKEALAQKEAAEARCVTLHQQLEELREVYEANHG